MTNTITRKRLLYKSGVEYMDGEGVYTMNHALGCPHGCKYPCYAYLTSKRFRTVDGYDDWCDMKVVEGAPQLLERELDIRRKESVKRVHMCFTTDPFPYDRIDGDGTLGESECMMHCASMDCIDVLNRRGIPVTVLTKGLLPEIRTDPNHGKELVLFDDLASVPSCYVDPKILHLENEWGISLVSIRMAGDSWVKQWEPGASPLDSRIERLRALSEAGMRTWVSMEPFPTPQIMEETCGCLWNAVGVLNEVYFVDRVVFGRWNYSDADDPSWYRGQAELLKEACDDWGIELIIKKGTLE